MGHCLSWTKSTSSVFSYYFGSDGTVYVPGSNAFVKSLYGTEDYIVYHAKHFGDTGYNRELRMQKFMWDALGNPVFGHPLPASVSMQLPSGEPRSISN
ncbi:family 43 glycosylhydrolase [Paenibacillus albus]|uniref:Uncharacterized protein n=1 Tax=Paenibacillus albus TaxID=2495582 RepID=A0A3Q8X8W0_9BACL|nr:family 43 glycosylhydrolase [Paenibacillus albus]AZN43126.1 hypothetical protein EJC50_28060 [Paenibacillus albus]